MIRHAEKRVIPVPTAACHAGTLTRMGGHTWAAWFGGTRESHPDVDIYFARLDAESAEPLRVSAGPEAHWNPVLLPRDYGLDLLFKYGPAIPTWRTMRQRIDARGQLMGQPEELVPGDVGGRGPVKNKCLKLRSGRLLAPTSTERKNPDIWKPFVDISDDGGETFTKLVPIPLCRAGEPALRDAPEDVCIVRNAGAIQPTLWEGTDGRVHALMRSSEGYILISHSDDGGERWSPAAYTGMPNNNSGLDLARLEDGRLSLLMNPVSGNWAARTPLSLYVSMDDGANFVELMKLEAQPGEYSYPAVIAEGLRLYVLYTWNRRRMAYWEIDFEAIPEEN